MKISYHLLHSFHIEDLQRIMDRYTSAQKYIVTRTEAADGSRITLDLQLVTLETPYVKVWDHSDPETEERYTACVQQGFSFGAYEGDRIVGLAIAEPHWWNGSLNIWEFGVASTHQRQGIGQGLMQQLEQTSRSHGLRVMVAETQNTNVPAIRFYHSVGFEFDALDLSFYSNHDVEAGEVAIFMKRKLM